MPRVKRHPPPSADVDRVVRAIAAVTALVDSLPAPQALRVCFLTAHAIAKRENMGDVAAEALALSERFVDGQHAPPPRVIAIDPLLEIVERLDVAEGVAGTWYYHLRKPPNTSALCGAVVMATEVSLASWGTRSHLNERWCTKCRELADAVAGARQITRGIRELAASIVHDKFGGREVMLTEEVIERFPDQVRHELRNAGFSDAQQAAIMNVKSSL